MLDKELKEFVDENLGILLERIEPMYLKEIILELIQLRDQIYSEGIEKFFAQNSALKENPLVNSAVNELALLLGGRYCTPDGRIDSEEALKEVEQYISQELIRLSNPEELVLTGVNHSNSEL